MASMRIYAGTGAVLGWLALALQLYLMLASTPRGPAWISTVINFISFFTILTNLLVAMVFSSVSLGCGGFLSSASVQAATTGYIAIVAIVYEVLLRGLWNPQGGQLLADLLLHTILPLAYVIFWLLFGPRAGLRWNTTLNWLLYPAVYLVYTLARGAVSGVYPYPFVDAATLGYGRVLINAAGFVIVFWGAGLLTIAAARWIPRPDHNP
jgi:hypothetical protein